MPAKVTVVGAGLIGRAWAITFARAGHAVALYDSAPGAAEAALGFVRTVADDLAAADLLRGSSPAALLDRLSPTDDLGAALAGTSHVQENAPERLEIKVPLFRELDAATPAGVAIASSTSGYLPSSFSDGLPGRARCLVAHPINPPYLIDRARALDGA